MAKKELSESETSGSGNSSSDEEPKTPEKAVTEYEKQRQLRIAENRARMEVLGLRKIANSLMCSADSSSRERRVKSKLKGVVKKVEEDDDYRPFDDDNDDDDDLSYSSEELEEESVYDRKSRSRFGKVKKSMSGKQVSKKQSMDIPNIMDEDEALMQAIALSLKDSGEISDLQHCGSSKGSNAQAASINKKGHGHIQEESTRRKTRKLFSSRVQMTEDDLVIHFCQLDEAGKESITLRDLQRMAAAHDFTWTDKELADMIHCFDSDRDGKLTLDDFQNIAERCNMLQGPENP